MGTGSFPGIKSGQGATLTPHTLLVLWSRKVEQYIYSPLQAVWSIQSLSACTWVLFSSPLPYLKTTSGSGSSVGIANDYGLDGPESNPGGGDKKFRPSKPTLGPTQPPVPGLSRG